MMRHQPQHESVTGDRGCEETLARSEEHVRTNRDAVSHEIGTHDANQYRRGRAKQFEFGIDEQQDYPWVAPRVILQSVNLDMGDERPKPWIISNYDGEASWREWDRMPNDTYKGDEACSANQYHRLTKELYNWEVATDEFIQKRDLVGTEVTHDHAQWRVQEWRRIKCGVDETCRNMFQEIQISTKAKPLGPPEHLRYGVCYTSQSTHEIDITIFWIPIVTDYCIWFLSP